MPADAVSSSPGMLPLPVPERGGSIEPCSPSLIFRTRTTLCSSWRGCSRPYGQRPLSAVGDIRRAGLGEDSSIKAPQGAGRPQCGPGQSAPAPGTRADDCGHNGHRSPSISVRLPASLSDALCRLASGGSFAVRQLYTDDEEVLFEAARPILLNGIEDIIGRSDLADLAILLTLGSIGEEQRRSETELWREFERARPAILGALLDAAAYGLRAVGSVHLGRLPRMADFALWATACETGLWPANTFTRAYAANRKAAIEGIIDADPIAACVREFMSERPSWTGSAADLLRVSVERSSDRIPKDGRSSRATGRQR